MKQKVEQIYINHSLDSASVFRSGGIHRNYHLTQLLQSRLAFLFCRMKIAEAIDIWPHGLGYYVEPMEEKEASNG